MLLTPIVTAILSLGLSFALTAALVPFVRRFARGGGLYEQPVKDRWHKRPVPKLGGVAMAAAFLPIAWHWADSLPLQILLVATFCVFALGLIDDLRPIGPTGKFLGQIGTAALFLSFAPPTDLTGEPVVDIILSFLWFVGITNAFNLLDNIDGLASGIGAIAGAFFVVALLLNGSPALTHLAIVVAVMSGVALGFLVHNWHPASIFMGDSGSHLIGSFFAGATLLAIPHMHQGSQAGFMIAVVILLVPCADTALVILTRHLSGRSAFVGGRDHLSHRMVALGMNERHAVLVLYGIAMTGGLAALGLQNLAPRFGWMVAIGYGIVVALVGIYLGRVRVEHVKDGTAPKPPVPDFAWRYPAYEILFDTALITFAYFLGLLSRFREAERFSLFLAHFLRVLPLVIVLHLVALWVVGRYRGGWRANVKSEALTILQGSVLGSAGTVIGVLYLTAFQGYSRQAFAVAAFLVVLFLCGGHVILRSLSDWLSARHQSGPRAIVYGAGHRGALAVRELRNNPNLGLAPFGIIDDDPARRSDWLEGVRVLGTIADLDAVIQRAAGRITTVIVTVRALERDRFAELCAICERYDVEVRQLRFSLDDVDLARRDRPSGIIRFPRA